MKIYFNGCSHTIGTPLSVPNPKDAFPYVLGEMYGAKVVCDALMGGSNDRIVRTTIEATSFQKFDLAIIQWSLMDRFETAGTKVHNIHMSRNRKGESDAWDFLQHRPETSLWPSRAHENIPFLDFYENILSQDKKVYNTNRLKLHRKYLTQILVLDGYLKNMGIRTIHMPFTYHNITNTLTKRIEKECELFCNWDMGIYEFLSLKGFELCKKAGPNAGPGEVDGHFETDAHKFIAERLANIIDNNDYDDEVEIDHDIEEIVQAVYDWE